MQNQWMREILNQFLVQSYLNLPSSDENKKKKMRTKIKKINALDIGLQMS
jgi:hypothetical protein